MIKAFWTLFKTETKLAIRGGDMLIFGIAMPAGIMLLIGYISSPETMTSAFSGVASVGICASGFMGIPLTLAGLRYEKILRQYKPTPASPALLLGAGSLLQFCFSAVSGILIFLIANLVFGVSPENLPRFALSFLFCIFTIFSLGFLIGSVVPDIRTANWVTTLIYFPSIFLSGTTVPFSVLPDGLQTVSKALPMTQAIMFLDNAVRNRPLSDDLTKIAVMVSVSLACYIISLRVFRWE